MRVYNAKLEQTEKQQKMILVVGSVVLIVGSVADYNLRPYLGNIFLVTITCIYEWFIFTKIYIFKKQATLSFHLGIINLRKNENTKILRMLNLF